MPEETVLETEVKTENQNGKAKVAGLGKPERVAFNFKNNDDTASENKTEIKDKATAPIETKNDETKAADIKSAAPNVNQQELSEEQIKSFLESKGIKYEGLDKLKEKVEYTPPVELTPEQIAQQQKAKEKRAIDLFVANGGTVDNYVAIKAIAESDLAELSNNALKKELKDAGFDEEKIKDIIKDRYFQYDEEEIEQDEDESDKEFKKRLKEYYSKKLENRSLHTKTQAQNILRELNSAIESEDLRKQNEVATSAKIDDYFKNVPRKLSFEIGEIDGKAISPVEYEVSESDIAEVKDRLKDPAKRNKHLLNKDGNLNLDYISDLELKNKYLESALKTAYHTGGSRQVEELRKVFPATSAQQLGIGGSPVTTNSNGKVAGYGKVQKVGRQQHN